ncbi:MAG: hypothetical protein HQK87_03755 [Nitrospinae bacterium]|nr:hypothetical protein [Nitrospinota bacterium]
MEKRAAIERALTAIFLMGTIAAAALWGAALTAECEGFGCLGVGAMLSMAVTIQFLMAVLGGVLLKMNTGQGKAPAWLLTIEALHLAPLVWFGARIMLS